jgi:hypothetical protein
LRLFSWDSGVSWNQNSHYSTSSFNTQWEWGYID